MTDFLHQQWKDLVYDYQLSEQASKRVVNKICSKYQQSQRFYHNLEHIKNLLILASDFESQIQDFSTFCFAIWFHDIIYNPQSIDNENKSALKAKKILSKFSMSETQIEKIAYYILCTKNHTQVESTDFDLLLFLDLDLSILGSTQKNYLEYAKNIQKEYNFVPIMTYNQKRKEFLEKMLAAPTIYKTAQAQDLFEIKARENLRYEIEFSL